ncbi:hypothetical protein EJ02DRAFT_318031, partial [Clathrospora elynae]
LFWKAWESSFKETTILRSFEATVLSPLNLEVILKRFTNTTPDDPDSRCGGSSVSISSTLDWRKINRLIHSAVKDKATKEAKKLSLLLHSISVQNQLLLHEVKGLREALLNKNKRQKHSKPLDLQQRKEYHGGAVVWSPRKFREARVCQTVKEHEEKEQQLQKAESAKLKKAAQVYKLKMDQEKRA